MNRKRAPKSSAREARPIPVVSEGRYNVWVWRGKPYCIASLDDPDKARRTMLIGVDDALVCTARGGVILSVRVKMPEGIFAAMTEAAKELLPAVTPIDQLPSK